MESKNQWKTKFDAHLDPEIDLRDRETLLKKLTKKQIDMLDHGENIGTRFQIKCQSLKFLVTNILLFK